MAPAHKFPRPTSKNWTAWLVQSQPPPAPSGVVLWEKTIPSNLKAVARTLTDLLQRLYDTQLVDRDPAVEVQTRLVLDEALVNCVKHGNKGHPKKKVFVTLYRLPLKKKKTGWGLILRDQGKGFDVNEVPNVDLQESLLLEHGRGVLLMRQFLDAVQYFDGGRALVMEKYRA